MREQFVALGYGVVGVSKDSDTSHTKFIDKCNLQIPLISDGNLVIHKYFDTIGEKKMFGKTYHGTIRSTFVVDTDGITLHERRKVKARGHAQTVYDTLAHTS
jgi:peroxiredoxin Q/BCP